MSHLAPLISDLALILISAGIMTLLFKKLKQPLVLGYIVAGFVCSPHFAFTPSVVDADNIQTWSEIGVIFLLFALGLEFSFKKLMKVGGSAVISACTIIFCMILVGVFVGWMFGWKQMDCIYLGGMLAMSSTTIIYKAFDDLGLRQQRFAGLVLSILILEDILAIVLMVMLSTMAVSKNFEGSEMIYSIGKLVFFLILWFVVGRKHHHQHNGQNIFQYQNTQHQPGKTLLPKSQIIKCLIDNGGGRHGQHSSQINAVHLFPSKHPAHKHTDQYHAEDNRTGRYDRRTSHLHQFLEAEFQSQRKQKEDDTNLRPRLDIIRIYHRRGKRKMRTTNKTCDNIA
jgi:hypothetical protein